MRDREGRGVPPDVDEVRTLLHRQAADHRPDADLIMRHVREATTGTASAAAASGPRDGVRLRFPRRLGPIAAAAAAVLVIVAVASADQWGSGPSDRTTPAASADLPSTGATPLGRLGSATSRSVAPPASGTGTRPARPDDVTSSPGPVTTSGPWPFTAPPTGTGSWPETAGSWGTADTSAPGYGPSTRASAKPPDVTRLGGGTAVDLSLATARDWVAVGARNDGVGVRAKAGTGEIAGVTSHGGTPAVAAGPLRVSWTGGIPEQNHVGSGTWWTSAVAGGFDVTVRLSGPGMIELYVGALDAPETVIVTRESGGTQSGSASIAAGTAVRLIVDARDARAGETVQLSVPAGRGGRAALSAVVVR